MVAQMSAGNGSSSHRIKPTICAIDARAYSSRSVVIG